MLSFAWGFLLSLLTGIGLSSLGRLYSPEELTQALQGDPTLLGCGSSTTSWGRVGIKPLVLEKQ